MRDHDRQRRPRPDPDALLAQVQAAGSARRARQAEDLLRRSRRRRQDLRDARGGARAAAREGATCVVGVVETHGRAETAALLDGPRRSCRARRVDYRGSDARASSTSTPRWRASPALILVDELAHTNAPGSRHPKRWQDVEELLDAGIDVCTTLNVQHLESLNDVVGSITGVRVRETRARLACSTRADEVELVDLPPDELLAAARRRQGLPARAGRARGAELLPQGQPDRAARARAAPHRRARRRRRAGLPRRASRSAPSGRPSAALLACVGPRPGAEHVVRSAARLASQLTPTGMRSMSRRRRCSACRRRGASGSWRR